MGWEARCLDPRCRAQVAKEKWDGIIPKSVFFLSMVGNHFHQTWGIKKIIWRVNMQIARPL